MILIIAVTIVIWINTIIENNIEHLSETDSSYSNCKVGCIIACRKRNGLTDPSCYKEDSDCYRNFMACYKICTDDCVII